MRKSIATFFLMCMTVSAWAVDLPKQGFGLQIGFARPTIRLNSSSLAYPKDSLVNTTALNGLKIGVVYDASFIAGFGSTMGINYTFAGGHTSWEKSGTIGDYPRSRTQVLYHEMEIFVDWQYKFEVAKETYLMLYTGPSIQCGLAYNVRRDTQTDFDTPISSDKYNRYGNERPNEDLKRLNVTWGVGAGFQYKRYFLRGGYDFGLINPYKNAQFVNPLTGDAIDRNTRGRLDQWSVKIGMYLLYK